MSSSSGGWTETVSPDPSASLPGLEASRSTLEGHTVLMSVRVSVCHSGIRPLCLPGAGDESLYLQLSMDPGKSGEFRLSLRDSSGTARSVTIADFDLRTVNYEVKSPKCHELSMAAPPNDKMSFNFRSEQEAQEWATVVVSSLREAQRVAETLSSNDPPVPIETPGSERLIVLQRREDSCVELSRAIEVGDVSVACSLAASLARQNAALRIQPALRGGPDQELRLAVVVEDCSSSCSVTVKVFPHATIAALKQQVFLEYGFPPRVQRWVIGQCLCADQRSLASYGVRRDGDTAYLYLLSSRHARLSPQPANRDQEDSIGRSWSQGLLASSTLPPRLGTGSSPGTAGLSAGTERENISEIRELINLEMPQLGEALSLGRIASSTQGWPCPSCTYINKPTRPGCEICSTGRPEGYAVPGAYRPDHLELRRIQKEKEAVRQYQQEKGRREETRSGRREETRSAGAQNNLLLLNLDQDP